MNVYDIQREAITQDRFVRVRAKIERLVEHMASAGKRPEHVAVFAGDYKALKAAINGRLRKEAKAAERAANIDKPKKAKIKIVPDKADDLTFAGIVLMPRTYTRHRAVKP